MEWITTGDVEAEVWRRILEFANLDIAFEEIATRHGPSNNNKTKANYEKQAKQIRVCLLQAREFFSAASESSLFTSPNHLYYGMLSLASAIMLLRGDGTHSLDELRKNKSNNHHGLDFTTGINTREASEGFKILENSRVEILGHGHFRNWYSTLPAREPVYARIVEQTGQAQMIGARLVGQRSIADPDSLKHSKRTLLDVLQFIPDLSMDLWRFKALNGVFSRLNYEVTVTEDSYIHQFAIHAAFGEGGIDAILDKFLISAQHIDQIEATDFSGNNVSCKVIFRRPIISHFYIEYPDFRRASDLSDIMYSRNITLPEIADTYICGYGLSMLSRYFPDYWIACIESHGKAAKLIERTVGLLLEKFPILALNMMARHHITISTHRPPWYT